MTGIQFARKEKRKSPERQGTHNEREIGTTNDRTSTDTKDIEAISLQDRDETQMTSDGEPNVV